MAQRKLYIYNEFRGWKLKTPDICETLKKVQFHGKLIADSADPKGIADLRDCGLPIYGAFKGAGSVNQSMKWLIQRNEIIIDPVRCPHTAEEFTVYEYDKTKDGEIISGYPDRNNHAIDAVRYALNEIWTKRGL